jgi:hypothetical protein
MKLRGAGRSFIVTGLAFIVFNFLVSLYGQSAKASRIGTLLLYVGIVLFIVGLSLRLARPRS